jgi:hypothetical protein
LEYKETITVPWLRTRDILNLSRDIYKQMRQFYEGLQEEELNRKNDVQRMQLLRDSIRRHAEYFETEIRAFKKEAPAEVLDAWFQFSPDPPELFTDHIARIGPDVTVDAMLRVALDFGTALAEFYQRVAESTEFEDVREIFLNLKNSVEEENKKLSFDTSGLKQL